MRSFNNYYRAVNFIEEFSYSSNKGNYMTDRSNPDIYLKRMRYFFDLIGNPDKGFKFIHITGTSGKGTVTNMIHEIIYASGKKVGSFTSPFVTTSIEKIKIDDLYISTDEFVDIVDYLKPFIKKAYDECPYGRVSYFEIFFSIALIYFKQQKCEWVVLEVGLGGRYDATNVIQNPIITAITNIDYDHTEILGKTLENIAYDKAGIIKTGSTFFTTESRSSIVKIFKEICDEKKVLIYKLPSVSNYQKNNINLVKAITKSIGIKDIFIDKGIKNASLQCRFETMQTKPIVVIDGAHNRAKIKSTIDNLRKLHFNKLYLIIAISANKDHVSILKQIIPLADFVFATQFKNKYRKSTSPKDIIIKSKEYLDKSTITKVFLDSKQALAKALKDAENDDVILITGSFFLAGEIRKHWISEEWILKNRKPFK